MTMTGSYKQSPAAKAAIDRALKMMSEGKSDKPPTREETKERFESRKKEQQEAQIKADRPRLAELAKRHAEMQAIHAKGKNWQYADREQNLSPEEQQARGIEKSMNDIGSRISAVKKAGYKHGGKVKPSKISTHNRSKSSPSW